MGRLQQTRRRGGRTEDFSIANGVRKTFTGLGDRINCLTSSGNLTLFIDNSQEPITFRTGIKMELPPGDDYTQFALENNSGGTVTGTVYYGFDLLEDDRTVLTGSIASPNTLRTTADTVINVNSNLDIPADTTRRTIVIRNNSTVDTLRVGDVANTGDARGGKIPPETTVSIDTSAAVRIRNVTAAAGNVTVSIFEVLEV